MDLIDSREAARLLGISRATVNRRAASGELPTAHTTRGRRAQRLFDRATIERLARQRIEELSAALDETKAAS